MSSAKEFVADVVKAKVDDWNYGLVQLPNGLEALLISDPTTDKAAAAMDVQVGSMSDPEELPGLAHFTEHMLFYASAKYPEEDEYSKWVSDHGGYTNAWTAAENTNYQFTVNHDHLTSTLDRFAQFFIAPLISADGIDRERHAVDSEHSKNLQSDVWRQEQLWKAIAHPGSAWSHFFTGSLETLGTAPEARGVDVRAALVDFYEREYSANRMRLCVLGREDVGELAALVTSLFGAVADKGLPRDTPHAGEPYPADRLGRLVRTRPVKEGHVVHLRWSIPRLDDLALEAPDGLLAHLIGHEGAGSLFSELKAAGWAKSLSAYGSPAIRGFSYFAVSVTLTDTGHERVDEVLTRIFQFIALLQGPGAITQATFDDNAALHELSFNYREKPAPFQYTSTLANNMQRVPTRHLLQFTHHVPVVWNEGAVRAVLGALRPEVVSIMWVSHAHDEDGMEVEPWYQQRFSNEPLPSAWVERWVDPGSHSALRVPGVNPFTPDDLTMLEPLPTDGAASDSPPQRVVDDDIVVLYHKTHLEFGAPKASLALRFILPACVGSVRAALSTALFTHLVSDDLNEIAYEAELAGFHWVLEPASMSAVPGLTLRITGFHAKLLVLLRDVAARLQALVIRPERFAVLHEKLAQDYRNWAQQPPYVWASRLAELALQTGTHNISDLLAHLGHITAEELQAFVDRELFRSSRVEGLLIGNVPVATAREVAAIARGALEARRAAPLTPSELEVATRLVRLPRSRAVAVALESPNAAEQNSAHLSLLQIDAQGDEHISALTELAAHIMQRPAFHQLRTVEQIGYLVYTYCSERAHVPHLVFLLQSSVLGAADISGRVHAFLRQWRSDFDDELSEEQFRSDVEELSKSKLEKPRTLVTIRNRWLGEILMARFDWKRPETEVVALRALSRADLAAFLDTLLLSSQRARLSVNVAGALERQRGLNAEPGGVGECLAAESAAAAGKDVEPNGRADGVAEGSAGGANGTPKNGVDGPACAENAAHEGENGATNGNVTNGVVGGKGAARQSGLAVSGVHGAWDDEVLLHVPAFELPQFRMMQSLWAQARTVW